MRGSERAHGRVGRGDDLVPRQARSSTRSRPLHACVGTVRPDGRPPTTTRHLPSSGSFPKGDERIQCRVMIHLQSNF